MCGVSEPDSELVIRLFGKGLGGCAQLNPEGIVVQELDLFNME